MKQVEQNQDPGRRRSRSGMNAMSGLAAVGVCLLLLACGGSSSGSNGSAGASNQSTKQETSRLKFTQCMREHGVNFSDTGGSPSGFQNTPQSTIQAAFSACRKFASGSFGNAASSSQQSQLKDQLVKYAACLREAGLNIADPTGTGVSGVGGFFRQLQELRQNPNFQQANSKCQKNLPTGGPFRGNGG